MSSAAVAGEATPAGAERLELAVEGMTSAVCAAQVEKRLGEIADVATSVNFATGIAPVTAPPEVPLAALIKAVGQAGYQAGPAPHAGSAAGQEPAGQACAGEDAASCRG